MNKDDSKKMEGSKDKEISVTSTLCNDCIFAKYEKRKQVDCAANRLNVFKDKGIDILEMVEDDGRSSFIIDNKSCIYYRPKKWSKEHYKTKSVKNILDRVKTELSIPYHAVLFFREGSSIEDLQCRIQELDNQSVKPKIVTVVDRTHTEDIYGGEIIGIFQKYSFQYWRVQTVQAIDQLDLDVVDLVYDSTKDKKYMFYTCFEVGHHIPENFSQQVHKYIQEDMQSFVILEANANNVGRTVLKIAHKKYNGFAFAIPLEEKLKHYDDAPHLIKKVEDVCPSLKA